MGKPVKTKYSIIPLHAMDEVRKNSQILDDLAPWLTQLLTIKNTEENVDKMEAVLVMVEAHARRLSIFEIKTAFFMYVMGELPELEPVDNYLTPILFGKVIRAYKQVRPTITGDVAPLELPSAEKEKNANAVLKMAFESWKEKQRVDTDYFTAFDTLIERGKIPPIEDEKAHGYYLGKAKRAQVIVFAESKKQLTYAEIGEKKKLRQLIMDVKEDINHPTVLKQMKCLVLEDYFKKYGDGFKVG